MDEASTGEPRNGDYRTANRAQWDERAPAHAGSPDYAVEQLVADPDRLSDVVRFDLPRLGDVSGLRGVHLQCHIGTDTLSLSRLGARMTGLDFSPASLAQARLLAERAAAQIEYAETDVQFTATVSHSWNHGLAETITALTDAGLTLTSLEEHDSVPWNALPGQMVEQDGEFRLRERPARLACSYTLQASKQR